MENLARTFEGALAALKRRDLNSAEELLRRVIEADSSNVPALNLLAVILMSTERFAEAEPHIARATSLNQTSDVSFYNYGLISKRLEKPQQALTNFSKAIALNPNVADSWNNRGATFNDLAQYDSAVADFDRAIAIDDQHSRAHANRGKALSLLGRCVEALAAYDKALSIEPGLAEAWDGRGHVLARLGRHDEALAAYDKALSIKPDLTDAWLGRGLVFANLNRHDEALAAFDKALSIKPSLAEACVRRGHALAQLNRHDEALAAYDKALSIQPDLTDGWAGRGHVFTDLDRHDEAFAAYDKAFSLNPDFEAVEGLRLHAKMLLCNWERIDKEVADLTSSVRAGKANCQPFVLLSLIDSAADHLRCSQTWVTARTPPPREQALPGPYKHDRIRIGYVSADFRVHPVGNLTAELFELHDKTRFETYAFSVGPNDHSDLRRRLEKSFHRFLDLNKASDGDVVNAIESSEIDILVDLNGHTHGERTAVFAQHPAPIAVNYLGFPGSMGARFYDYAIADRWVVPRENLESYTEKLAYMPDCFMPHDKIGGEISDEVPRRADNGLPDNGFVFCCFTKAYKLNPEIFGSWMKILEAVGNSVLWLSAMSKDAQANLRKEATKSGIDPDRLVFAERTKSFSEHLARHQLADLFLDTLPYNAHTSASDALWAGLPVVTRIGRAFAGRVAASLLNAIELPELITPSHEQYEALAIGLALDPAKLQAIKGKLARNRLSTRLFDTPLYARHLESAYEAMYQRCQAGLPPDHIDIKFIH